MEKKYLLVLISSFLYSSLNIICCPCNISKTDPRPFFEQYESPESNPNNTEQEKNSQETDEQINAPEEQS